MDPTVVVPWTTFAAACVALAILDTRGPVGKWHAALSWTLGVAVGMELWPRQRLASFLFWMLWLVFLAAHIFAMWLLFGVLLPRLRLGTLFVFLPSVFEGFFLGAVIWSLSRKFDRNAHGKIARRGDAKP